MPKYAEEILAAVTELQQHPTAEQVFLEMKREHPSIAIGTVYKHLNALAGEGLLHRITESGLPDRYDRTERHDHLICSRCGEPDSVMRCSIPSSAKAFRCLYTVPRAMLGCSFFISRNTCSAVGCR